MLPKFSVYDIIIHMIFSTQIELESFAEQLGAFLKAQKLPLVLELIGDVGVGKTTFTRALAHGLGITAPVTSPSFTICNRYQFTRERSADENCANHRGATPVVKNRPLELIHYDFYRLEGPGLMRDDLAESLANKNAIVVLEWAQSVADLLPKDHIQITFEILEDDSRKLEIKGLKK